MKSSNVDLLHVAYGGLGGHQGVVNKINEGLTQLGLDTAVLGVTRRAGDQTDPAFWMSTQYIAVQSSHPAALARRLFLKSVIFDLRPRVILAHTHGLVPEIMFWSRRHGASPALVLREGQASNLRGWKDNLHSRLALRSADGLIFVSQEQADSYPVDVTDNGGRPVIAVIPNATVPTEGYVRNLGDTRVTGLTIGMACRLVPSKRVDLLIDVSAELIKQGLPVRTIIAGNGPDRERLERRASKVLPPNEFQFLGELPRNEMSDFYGSLNAYVHLTDGEGESNAVLEAAGYGLPIILSEMGERIMHGIDHDGFVRVRNDAQIIASEILDVCKDHGRLLQMGDRNLQFVIRERSLGAMVASYCKLFSRVDYNGPWLSVFDKTICSHDSGPKLIGWGHGKSSQSLTD